MSITTNVFTRRVKSMSLSYSMLLPESNVKNSNGTITNHTCVVHFRHVINYVKMPPVVTKHQAVDNKD